MENSRTHTAPDWKRCIARTMMGVIGLFIIFLLVAWWRLVSDEAVVTIPNPVMPSPNAFDFYAMAGRSLVNTKQIDAAIMTKPIVPMTLAQKEALVRQNAGALQSLHQGFAYEYRNPPARSFSALFPYFANYRRIARLLAVQSQVRGERGNWSGASESALDAIRLGEDVPRGGVVIAQLVGNACEAIGQKAMWKTVEHLNAAQSRAAAQRLQTIMDRHFPYADTMQEEKWMGQAGLTEMLRGVTMRNVLSNANGLTGSDMPAAQRYSMAFYMLYGKKRILQNYTEHMDAVTAQARQPFAAKLLPLPIPSDPINQIIAPVFYQARFTEVKTETQNSLLLVALALHAYRLEHGRYPATLAELMPSYLNKIPGDLFALRKPLTYRIDGETYLLYSIGPDGTDDTGSPVDDPAHATVGNPKGRYRVDKESIGDIVAGINTP
ncbi:MAG: hypothetical protein JWL77_5670 [Chthonomonadaceae bacterium]|nr:hypothetical protein [Chthonomonadaceae bacterium]